jgi:cytochrome c
VVSVRFVRMAGFVAIAALMYPVAGFAAAKGDPARGEEIYAECSGCHDLKENRIGPKHCGVVGRKAASVADYPSYSEPMRDSEIVWDVTKLDEFLQAPLSYVPGTAMGYAGLYEEKDRADLIAYLAQATADSKLCGGTK